jgi:hypothetical protein
MVVVEVVVVIVVVVVVIVIAAVGKVVTDCSNVRAICVLVGGEGWEVKLKAGDFVSLSAKRDENDGRIVSEGEGRVNGVVGSKSGSTRGPIGGRGRGGG